MDENFPKPIQKIIEGQPISIESVNPEDVVLIQPTKPMTAGEVLKEMEKQGMRPLTLGELEAFVRSKQKVTIEPKDSDIEGKFSEIKE